MIIVNYFIENPTASLPCFFLFLLFQTFLLALCANRITIRNILSIFSPLISCVFTGWVLFDYNFTRLITSFSVPFFDSLHFKFAITAEGAVFAFFACCLWLITSVYAVSYMETNYPKSKKNVVFFAFLNMAMACVIGFSYSYDLLSSFIFYELLTICTYPLVTYFCDQVSIESGKKYIIYLQGSSLLFLLPAVVLVHHYCKSLDFQVGGIMWDVPITTFSIIFALFVFGIAKNAIFPLHGWLPSAMTAPLPASALLHAVAVVNAGVLMLIKGIVYIFGAKTLQINSTEHWYAGGWLTYVAITGIIVSSFYALQQKHIKKLLAYSTIVYLSYMIMCVSLYTDFGIKVAVLQMLTHGLSKITLFFCAGAVYTSSGTEYRDELDGLINKMPFMAIAVAVSAFSMIGLPPFVNFWSKLFMVGAVLEKEMLVGLATLIASSFLGAYYYSPMIYNVLFKAQKHTFYSPPLAMSLSTFAAAILVILTFSFPDYIFKTIDEMKPSNIYVEDKRFSALYEKHYSIKRQEDKF